MTKIIKIVDSWYPHFWTTKNWTELAEVLQCSSVLLGSPAKLVQFQSPKRLGHQKRQEVVLSSTNDLENIRPTKAIALPALPVAHPRGQHFWQRKHTLDMSLHWQFSSPLLADDLYWGLYSIVGMRGFCAKSCVWKSEAAMIAGCCNGCSLWGIHPKTARLGAAEIPHTA